MLRAFTQICVNMASRFFCFGSNFNPFCFLSVWGFTSQEPLQIVQNWGFGAWNLLAFSMQMALVLVLGQALASAKIISSFLQRLADIPKGYFSAILTVSFLGLVANLINWGFFWACYIGDFCKRNCKKVKGEDYRLLIAAAYSGFVVWHGGLSGSIPLTLSSGGEALAKSTAGILTEGVPSSMTIFSGFNLTIIVVCLPFLLASIHPTKENTLEIDKKLLEQENKDLEIINYSQDKSLAVWLENSFWVSASISILGFVYIVLRVGI